MMIFVVRNDFTHFILLHKSMKHNNGTIFAHFPEQALDKRSQNPKLGNIHNIVQKLKAYPLSAASLGNPRRVQGLQVQLLTTRVSTFQLQSHRWHWFGFFRIYKASCGFTYFFPWTASLSISYWFVELVINFPSSSSSIYAHELF